MSPRMGRPTKGQQKRDIAFGTRLNQEELELLNECSERLNIPRTDVIVKGIRLVKQELDKEE